MTIDDLVREALAARAVFQEWVIPSVRSSSPARW